MSAAIVPFPSIRRQPMIERNAQRFAELRDPTKSFQALVDGVRSAHERKGVAPHLVDRDIRDLELALRSHMGRFHAEAGGAA